MVTRQAHTMSVGVIPGFCIWYGPMVSEQGPAWGAGRLRRSHGAAPHLVRGVSCTGSASVASYLSR